MGGLLSCCPSALNSATRTFTESTNHINVNFSTHNLSETRNNNFRNNTNYSNNNVFGRQRFTSANRFSGSVWNNGNIDNNNNNNNNTSNDCCDICGIHLDPTLLDGHREVCRINARRMHRLEEERQQRNYERRRVSSDHGTSTLDANAHVENNAYRDRWGNENDDRNYTNHAGIRSNKEDNNYVTHSIENERNELCVVCLDKQCEYAFLPCGHIVCCSTCAYMLETCPICRCSRTALCHVEQNTLSQFKCPHCKEFIAPTYFDGHREVCATRMRWQNKEGEKVNECEECCELSQNERENVVSINEGNDETEQEKIIIGSRVSKYGNDMECESQDENSPVMESEESVQQENTNELIVGQTAANKNNMNVSDNINSTNNCSESADHVSNNDYAKRTVNDNVSKSSYKAAKCVDTIPAAKHSQRNDTTSAKDSAGKTLRCVECNNLYHWLMLCLPCGHRVMCENCSNKRSTCPVCLQNITKVIKAYQ